MMLPMKASKKQTYTDYPNRLTKIAQSLELLHEGEVLRAMEALKKAMLPVSLPGIDVEKVYNQMFYDKKVKNNKLRFVLPKHIGEVLQCNIEDTDMIKRVIGELGQS